MSPRSSLLPGLLFLAACGASTPGSGSAQDAMSDDEFDRRLREALMREPEVIIEAIEAYRAALLADAETASRDVVADLMPELIEARSGHAMGASAEDADVVLIEFFDYHCGFCKRALDDVLRLADNDESLRVVFQDFPILRDESRTAALAAASAATLGPDTYTKVHTELLRTDGVLGDEAVKSAMKRAGVSLKDWNTAQAEEASATEALIKRSEEIGREVGVGGTPYFIVIGTKTGTIEVLEGYRPDVLMSMVENARS